MKNILIFTGGALAFLFLTFSFINEKNKKEIEHNYHWGYSDALDTINVLFKISIEDSNKVIKEANIINCDTCCEEQLKVDTISYVIYPANMLIKNRSSLKKDLSYYKGYSDALDTISNILSSHLADTNKVRKITIIYFNTHNVKDLSVDTNSYVIYPKNRIVKGE